MSRSTPEADWKTLRRLQPTLLNRLCETILADVANASTGPGTPHERYLRVYELVHERDKHIGHAFNNLRRSSALIQMMAMRSMNLFTEDEFKQLTQETRNSIDGLLSISSSQ